MSEDVASADRLRGMFKDIDADGGGEIDSEEFEQWLRNIGSRIAEEDSDDWTSTERTHSRLDTTVD